MSSIQSITSAMIELTNAQVSFRTAINKLDEGVSEVKSLFNKVNKLHENFIGKGIVTIKEKYQGGWAVNDDGKEKFMYNFPMAQLTVDILYKDKSDNLLFIVRGGEPYKDCLALPGGFVDIKNGEEPETAALREGKEECNLDASSLSLITSIGNLKRDPRGYTHTSLYFAEVDSFVKAEAGDDARELRLVNMYDLEKHLKSYSFKLKAVNPKTNEESIYSRDDTTRGSVFAFDHEVLLTEAVNMKFI